MKHLKGVIVMYYPSIFSDKFYDELIDDFMNFPFDFGKQVKNEFLPKQRCSTDIKEFKDKYVFELELPGYEKTEVKAELKKGYLVITAEHADTKSCKTEDTEAKDVKEETKTEDKPKYIMKERFYGKIERSFFVGKDVKKEDIKARFTNGVLCLEVPKPVKKQEEEEREYVSILD